MTETSYLYGLSGGLLIGFAASMYLLCNGRIMGASGILADLLSNIKSENWYRALFFVIALVTVPWIANQLLNLNAQTNITDNMMIIIIAGLLVGFGSHLANGCTSGHGVCGISRFAPRGIIATLIYLAAGMVSLYIFRHMIGIV